MRTYIFTLLISGVDDADEGHVEALIANDEVVMMSSIDGSVSIDLAVEATSPDAALRAGVHIVELAVPGASVCSVDLDLVAATDIAQRVDVSRQAVNQWVAGSRAVPAFPAALGHVAGGTRVWAWSAVVPWLHNRGKALDECTPTYASIVEANALLAHPRQPGRLATAGEWHRPELRTGGRTPTVRRPAAPRRAGGRIVFTIGDEAALAA